MSHMVTEGREVTLTVCMTVLIDMELSSDKQRLNDDGDSPRYFAIPVPDAHAIARFSCRLGLATWR